MNGMREAVRSRAGWKTLCLYGLEKCREVEVFQQLVAERGVVCEVCSRSFRREGDKKRHKCVNERMMPVSEQRGAAQCLKCREWFRSRGGLALHSCHDS